MSCSTARQLANQRNAQKSTGPKTEAGKLVARLNSLTHGMRSEHGLVPPHLTEAVAKHNQMMIDAYHPETDNQRWLLEQVADAAAKLDYCQFMIRAHHDDQMDRANLCWDEDQQRVVEDLAARLPKAPSRVASQLIETSYGCQWLLARWNALSCSLTAQGGWDESQCNLAAHLLGVGSDLRASHPSLHPGADPVALADLLRDETDALQSLLDDALEPLNAKERELARLGFSLRPSKELLRLQRYETRLRKVYTEAMNAFRLARTEGVAVPEPISCLAPEPAAPPLAVRPEPIAEPEPEPEPSPDDSLDDPQVASRLALVLEALRARVTLSSPLSVPPQPPAPSRPAPHNRKARRASEKAARKLRKAHAR